MSKKAFIGYDLGDGETITDFSILSDNQIKESVQTVFVGMTMPDSNTPGQAIPTAYGFDQHTGKILFASSILSDPGAIHSICVNFKRRPSDLLDKDLLLHAPLLFKALQKKLPTESEWPLLYTEPMRAFIRSVVTFTDALFGDPVYQEFVRSSAVDCESIVFAVGHPTRWDDLDVALYKAILAQSILGKGSYAGKPTELVMAAESRAAFLYVKDKAHKSVLPKDTCALLIDVGSSTIDLTAMTADSRNHQYNSGSNYLGARSIDYIIREQYLKRLSRNPDDWQIYNSLMQQNPTMDMALTLCCRKAKEDVFSVSAGKAYILFSDFPLMRITREEVEEAIRTMPVGPVLRQYIGLPDKEAKAMGEKSWAVLFQEFLQEKKVEMDTQGLHIGRIILTGSASRMPIVPVIIKKVFHDLPQDSVLADMNPSRSISMGLALVGPSNEKSKGFQRDLEVLMKETVPEVVEQDLPKLAEELAGIIEGIVNEIVKSNILRWRRCEISTLNAMMYTIKRECNQNQLNHRLAKNKQYNDAIKHWTVDVVGKDIAKKLQVICQKYGVDDLSLDQLNAMKVASIDVGGLNFNPMADIMDGIVGALAVIAGVIAAIILPTVLGIVVGLISWISVGLAVFLLDILLMLPGVGWAILLGLVGIAVIKAAAQGMEGAKRDITRRLQEANLPQWVRDRMTDATIDKKLAEAGMKEKIKAAILEEKSKKQIVAAVTENLSRQIAKRAEDIKYVIESK